MEENVLRHRDNWVLTLRASPPFMCVWLAAPAVATRWCCAVPLQATQLPRGCAPRGGGQQHVLCLAVVLSSD